jgi:hypothetical protein
MSHVVSIETQVRDPIAVAAACRRLGLPQPEQGTAQLFSGQASGLLVRLPGWTYPVVCDSKSGSIQYDNYKSKPTHTPTRPISLRRRTAHDAQRASHRTRARCV